MVISLDNDTPPPKKKKKTRDIQISLNLILEFLELESVLGAHLL